MIESPITPAETESRNGTALVIEDNAALRNIVAFYLEDLNYQVHQASGHAQTAHVLQQLDQIDLVVSDVLLEGSARGPEVVEGILQHSSTTRVIFMTGYAGHEPLPSNNLVLQKPFDRATFLSAVAEVTGRALAPPKVMQSLL